MSDVIRVLQLGTEDWRKCYKVPDYVDFIFAKDVFSEVCQSGEGTERECMIGNEEYA